MTPVWNKLQILRGLFGTQRLLQAELHSEASRPIDEAELARRWSRAARDAPELRGDVIRLGGLLVAQPSQGGEVLPLDPYRLAYDAGRRDLALQLAAMMALTPYDLNAILEDPDA